MPDKTKDQPSDPNPVTVVAVAAPPSDRPAVPSTSVDALKIPATGATVTGGHPDEDEDKIRIAFVGPGDEVIMDGIRFLPNVEHTLSREQFERLRNTPGTTWDFNAAR